MNLVEHPVLALSLGIGFLLVMHYFLIYHIRPWEWGENG